MQRAGCLLLFLVWSGCAFGRRFSCLFVNRSVPPTSIVSLPLFRPVMLPNYPGIILLLPLISTAIAQASSSDEISHGMDMDMDMGMVLAQGQMLPYLHFHGADMLWFQGWVPQTKGAIAGACIGLFLMAILDRWLAAMRSVAEVYWNKRAQIALANKLTAQGKRNNLTLSGVLMLRTIPPFIPSHDVTRGFLQGAQSLLSFAFMLAAMTFNAGIILSIIIGLGVGETLFGRFAVSRSTITH